MHIALLYNRDIYALTALNALVPELSEHTLTLFYSERVGGKIQRDPRLEALSVIETTFVDFPGLDFEQLAASVQCDAHGVADINGTDAQRLSDAEPDLIISIRFGQIIREHVIALPRLGVMNLHSGLLPQYKGVMASFWSLLNRESELGTTLHWITDSNIDSGHRISERAQPVRSDQSYKDQVLSLYAPGVEQILDAVGKIDTLAQEPREDLPAGDYYSFPSSTQLDRFESAGWRLY